MSIDNALVEYLSDVSATTEEGDHLVRMDYDKFIHLDGLWVTPRQASGHLSLGDWTPVTPTCGLDECICPDHLSSVTDVADAQEQRDLHLVQTHTRSLADLFKKAKGRGLLTARTEYGG